jgi:hypothetical protein
MAAAAVLMPGQMLAQGQGAGGGQRGGGGFDPEQMRQRMEERMREAFAVKDDAEWKIISERIQKVNDARRDVSFGGGMRAMFRPPGGGPGGDNQGNRGGGNRARFGGEPSAEEDALAKAIESKASKEELKSAMAKYREARKAKEDALAKAQDDLKAVLNVQQEAVALQYSLVR